MPEIKIVTEVAGRVCALAAEAGASVGDGDEIAFVEAMKMEIPVTSTIAGKIKAIIVKVDDVVAEGQVVATSRPKDFASDFACDDCAAFCPAGC